MDSASLLDLLGNRNRRRILRLLSHKPCYVTEISEYLGVSPKAVIDHLRKLEEAGLVESRVDEQRRKYFNISRNLRLEVNVSPYGFGAKSAYPASASLDMTSCRYLSLDVQYTEDTESVSDLAAELSRLEALENELSLAQRWVHGRITDVMDKLSEHVGGELDSRLYVEILTTLASGSATVGTLSEQVEAPPAVVEEALLTMAEGGLVAQTDGAWRLTE